jgi:hypothetical protein
VSDSSPRRHPVEPFASLPLQPQMVTGGHIPYPMNLVSRCQNSRALLDWYAEWKVLVTIDSMPYWIPRAMPEVSHKAVGCLQMVS